MRNKIYICPFCDKKIEKPDIIKAVAPISLGISKLCHLDCVKKKIDADKFTNTVGNTLQKLQEKKGGQI